METELAKPSWIMRGCKVWGVVALLALGWWLMRPAIDRVEKASNSAAANQPATLNGKTAFPVQVRDFFNSTHGVDNWLWAGGLFRDDSPDFEGMVQFRFNNRRVTRDAWGYSDDKYVARVARNKIYFLERFLTLSEPDPKSPTGIKQRMALAPLIAQDMASLTLGFTDKGRIGVQTKSAAARLGTLLLAGADNVPISAWIAGAAIWLMDQDDATGWDNGDIFISVVLRERNVLAIGYVTDKTERLVAHRAGPPE